MLALYLIDSFYLGENRPPAIQKPHLTLTILGAYQGREDDVFELAPVIHGSEKRILLFHLLDQAFSK